MCDECEDAGSGSIGEDEAADSGDCMSLLGVSLGVPEEVSASDCYCCSCC